MWIVGGGAAGLSAALVLGRARRQTLVVDAGAQSNLAAHGISGHMATMLLGWSDDVVLLTSGPADLTDENRSRLSGAGIRLDERVVVELPSADGELAAVVFDDGTSLARGGLLVASTLHQRSALASKLGVRFAQPSPVSVEPIEIDAMYRTSVSAVFAAGDVCVQMPQVAAAIAAGSAAAAAVVASFLEEK